MMYVYTSYVHANVMFIRAHTPEPRSRPRGGLQLNGWCKAILCMYTCKYVSIFRYVRVQVRVYVYVHMHMYMFMYMYYVYVYVYMHTCACIFICIFMRTCMCMRMYICTCICICTCTCTCIYIYVCVNVHENVYGYVCGTCMCQRGGGKLGSDRKCVESLDLNR